MAKKTYTKSPEVPEELRERHGLVVKVISGELTVAEAARQAGLSRPHFTSVRNRAEAGLIEALVDRPGGRPGKSGREAELEAEVAELRRENARLSGRVEMIDRLLGVAGGLLKGRVKTMPPRKTSRPAAAPAAASPEPASDEDEARQRLEAVRAMKELGVPLTIAAAIAGWSAVQERRLYALLRAGRPLRQRRPAWQERLPPEVEARLEKLVRDFDGLMGAAAMSRREPDVSRRQAAAVKRATLTTMEHERRLSCERVVVTAPGAVAGLDQLHLRGADGKALALILADGACPHRRSADVVDRYLAEAVAAVIAADFERHGAPLVLRLDRHSSHRHDLVQAVARQHSVLLLHGPPRHPQYYGQLERQNRDHRAIAEALRHLPLVELAAELWRRIAACNEQWPRRSLGWSTPAEVWSARPRLDVDRQELREEVEELAARLKEDASSPEVVVAQPERFAIEAALTRRGLLRREVGGWC